MLSHLSSFFNTKRSDDRQEKKAMYVIEKPYWFFHIILRLVMLISLPILFNEFVFAEKALFAERWSMNTIPTKNSSLTNGLFRYHNYIYCLWRPEKLLYSFRTVAKSLRKSEGTNVTQYSNSSTQAPQSTGTQCLLSRIGDFILFSQRIICRIYTQITALPAEQDFIPANWTQAAQVGV